MGKVMISHWMLGVTRFFCHKPTFGIEASNFEGMRTVLTDIQQFLCDILHLSDAENGLSNCLGLSVFKTYLVHSDSWFQINRKKNN